MSERPAPPSTDMIQTRSCAFWMDRFLRARFLDGAEVTLEDARENLATSARMYGGRVGPVLVDLRVVRSQTAEARAFFASSEATAVINQVALLIGSPLSRVLGNFYLGFNRPEVPTRLFTDEADAVAWIEAALDRTRG